MSSLDFGGEVKDDASIFRPEEAQDPGTRTDASADGTGVLRCLWSECYPGVVEANACHCDTCCLISPELWLQRARQHWDGDPERLFS